MKFTIVRTDLEKLLKAVVSRQRKTDRVTTFSFISPLFARTICFAIDSANCDFPCHAVRIPPKCNSGGIWPS
jgi:hypothetical protein